MTRLRNVGGTITKTTVGDHKIYSEGNIVQNAGGTIIETGKEKGVNFGKPESPPVLKLENGVDIFVEFRPLANFDGEFGFDWLEWDEKDAITKVQDVDISNFEYIYDNSRKEYVAISTDANLKNKIKEEYKKHQINYPYYVPWLNIFPEEEIKLNMLTKSIIAGEDVSKEVITFEKNDYYQVTIDGLVNENIKYTPTGQPKEISIKCIKPSAESDIIAKNEKGKIVGKIRVKDNISTYVLPVRLVCVVKKTLTADTEINQLISDFKSNKIEYYLNKNSLNQALIKTNLEIDSKYHIAFDENDWSGKFYDKTNDWFTNRKVAGGKVTYTNDNGDEVKNVDYEHILDKFLTDYRTGFETDGKKFKGILLFISNIAKDPADKEGGVSRTTPVDFREAIVFKNNLKSESTYAHEIAHALGLEHFFWRDAEYKDELEKTKDNLKEHKEAIEKNKNNIKISRNNIKISNSNIDIYNDRIKEYEAYQKNHPHYYKENPQIFKYVKEQKAGINKEKEDIKKAESSIKENQDVNKKIEERIINIENNLTVFKSNKYKFKEKATLNMMDYSSKINTFSCWQWEIMQADVKKYYGSVTSK